MAFSSCIWATGLQGTAPREIGQPVLGQSIGGGGGSAGGRRRLRRCCIAAARQQIDDGSSEQRASSTDGDSRSSSSRSKPQRQRRAKAGARREDLAFFISRSDLSWEQPWRFSQSASVADLRLREQGLSALDAAAAAAEGRPPATADFTVQLPTGLGALVVAGTAAATLPLRCEFCSEPYNAPLAGCAFDAVVYLGAAPGAKDGLAANELVFDLDASDLCDLTPLVADALMSELPTVCLCGGRSCRQHEGRQPVWTSSTPEAAGSPGAAAATSPFAQQLLKARGGKGGNKKRK